jgi:hypothetical protein
MCILSRPLLYVNRDLTYFILFSLYLKNYSTFDPYVEPVVTGPGWVPGIAYVGSDQEFYKSLGINKIYNSKCGIK